MWWGRGWDASSLLLQRIQEGVETHTRSAQRWDRVQRCVGVRGRGTCFGLAEQAATMGSCPFMNYGDLFEGRELDPEKMIDDVALELAEFKGAVTVEEIDKAELKWRKPPRDFIKLNCDAAVDGTRVSF